MSAHGKKSEREHLPRPARTAHGRSPGKAQSQDRRGLALPHQGSRRASGLIRGNLADIVAADSEAFKGIGEDATEQLDFIPARLIAGSLPPHELGQTINQAV